MSVLTDEFLLEFLSTYLTPRTLVKFSRLSRATYCFGYHDDLWREFTIKTFSGSALHHWTQTWRNTYKTCHVHSHNPASPPPTPDVPIQIPNFYSDHLFHTFRCSTVPLTTLTNPTHTTIPRESAKTLSVSDFQTRYANLNTPVIIIDLVTTWPAFTNWSTTYLSTHFGSHIFRAESVDVPFDDYLKYMEDSKDEAPLYLFDKWFGRKVGDDGRRRETSSLVEDYTVPEYFSDDLFSLLGDERPDYRWLIIGPERSGSTFHVDPNATSAWNAVLSGRKKWILYPPHIPPPGVFPTPDGSEVTSPTTLSEWYINHYHSTTLSPHPPIECVCEAGELLYVPSGWWHSVMNLQASIAVTQNFVVGVTGGGGWGFLLVRRGPVSGVGGGAACEVGDGGMGMGCGGGGGLYEKFLGRLREGGVEVPKEFSEEQSIRIRSGEGLEKEKKKVGMWSRLMEGGAGGEGDGSDGGAFAFSF
ncbi:hypothetical protein HDV00_008147 [Rhizophlyctis rosea]|nr:hypothetical protein HDV00_008147 [Rhizophlyctis rosea]